MAAERNFQVYTHGCGRSMYIVFNMESYEGPCGFLYGPELSQRKALCDQCRNDVAALNQLLRAHSVAELRSRVDDRSWELTQDLSNTPF